MSEFLSPVAPEGWNSFLLSFPDVAILYQEYMRKSVADQQAPPARIVHSAPPTSPAMPAMDIESESSSSSSDEFQLVQGKKRKAKSKSQPESASKRRETPAISPRRPPTPLAPRTSTPTPPTPRTTTPTSQSRPPTPSQVAPTKKQPLPPPLFVHDKSKWTEVSNRMSVKKINFSSARNTQEGIRVQVPSSSDYRELTKLLKSMNVPFHTFTLPEEKKLRVILRNIAKEVPSEAISEDLKSQGFPVLEVHRMHRGKTLAPYDMVLVILDLTPEGKAIFNLKTCCSLSGLKVETPHKKGPPGQCHNCQHYGHSSRNCFAKPRCVKCLGDHGTAACPRPKDRAQCTEPPSCVLCGEQGHTANYRGCPKAPRTNPKMAQRSVATRPERAVAPRPQPHSAPRPQPHPVSAPQPVRLAPQWPKPWTRPSVTPYVEAPAPALTQAPALAPAKPSQARQPQPSAGPRSQPPGIPTDMNEDILLLQRFANCFDFEEVRYIANAIRSTEEDGMNRFFIADRFYNLIQTLGAFKSSLP